MLFTTALTGFITGAGLIVAIGAQNAFVLRQGLQRNYVGLVVATAALSDIVLILCGVAGIGVLIKEWPELMQLLRFGGAAFLAVYGLRAAHRAWRGIDASLVPSQSSVKSWQRVLLACLAFTFLNPHVYLDTMVLVGSLSTRYPGAAQWAFGIGACVASVVWFTSLGYGSRLLRPVFSNPQAWRVLDALIAVFMLGLCALLLLRPL